MCISISAINCETIWRMRNSEMSFSLAQTENKLHMNSPLLQAKCNVGLFKVATMTNALVSQQQCSLWSRASWEWIEVCVVGQRNNSEEKWPIVRNSYTISNWMDQNIAGRQTTIQQCLLQCLVSLARAQKLEQKNSDKLKALMFLIY